MKRDSEYLSLAEVCEILGLDEQAARIWCSVHGVHEHKRARGFAYSARYVFLELAIEAGGPDGAPVQAVLCRHPSLVNDAALRRARKETV